MSDESKERVKRAIEKWHAKQTPTTTGRKNEKPEKDVEREVMSWLKAQGFHATVVESKSTFNPVARRYISQSVKAGTCDIVGNDPEGRAVFIELKAPGRRSTLSEKQRDFLELKIETNCFAVCIDSVQMLRHIYTHFVATPDLRLRKELLLLSLPKKKAPTDDDWNPEI